MPTPDAAQVLIAVVGPAVMATTAFVRATRGGDDRSDDERRALLAFAFAFVALTGAGVALVLGALTVALTAVVGAFVPAAVGFAFWWRSSGRLRSPA